MKTEFNLLPSDYASHPPSPWRRLLGRFGFFFARAFCFAEFSAVALYHARQLNDRRLALLEEERTVMGKAAALNERFQSLAARRNRWQSLLAEAQRSVPAVGLLAAAYQWLPQTGAVDRLLADERRCEISGVLADPEELESYLRDLGALPGYGPFRLMERRLIQRGAVAFRIEAPRRRP